MSKFTEHQENIEFLRGKVAESVGDYFAIIERYEEAREEYLSAIAAYDQVLSSADDFVTAQENKEIVGRKLSQVFSQAHQLIQPRNFPAYQPAKSGEIEILVNLSQMFQNVLEVAGQTLDALLISKADIPAFRERNILQVDVNSMLDILRTTSDENIRREAIKKLGQIAEGDAAAIRDLIEIIQTSKNEETRWQAVLSLGKIDPENLLAGLAFSIPINLLEVESPLELIVAYRKLDEQQISIRLQLTTTNKQLYLPPYLQLVVLDESGEIFDEAVAERNTSFIQIPPFEGSLGERFRLAITLGTTSITLDFIINRI